jgi:predicted small secreted protein
VGALIFVSDGNYNVGGNPIYAAEKLNLTPIFTLGIGDTVPKKDHFIRNTVYNDVVFLKNKFPIEVDIEANRLQNKTTRLSLWQNGKMLDATTINYSNEKHQFHQHTFLVDATTPGFQTYKVKIDVIEGESSIKNNEQLLYVEVVDSRSSVLFLSTAPHPDISAIKSAIDQNETIESSYILTKDMNYSAKKPDLVVWHEPGVQFDPKLQNYFNDNHIPVLYILGPNTPATISNKLNIVALSNSKNQSDEVLAGFNTAFSTFELSESCKQAIDFFPPLVSKFGSVRAINPTDILLFQRIGSVTKTDPLFFFGKNTQQNYGVIYGEGIWKWKLNDFIRSGTHDNFNELINKSINYLLLKRQGEGLSVSFPKRFTKEEPVIVSASFYNASLEPISTPIVSMVMKNEKGTTFKSQFGVVGTNYKLNAGKLAPGKYSWQVSTVYKGKTYSKSGYFIVDDIQLEQNNSSANHSTLKQLSIQSNGKYRFLKDYEKTLSEIAARNDITAVEYEEKVFLSLIDLAWLLTLLLILLSLEWFTRRYMGTY